MNSLQKWQLPDLSIVPYAIVRALEHGFENPVLIPFPEIGAVISFELSTPCVPPICGFVSISTPDGGTKDASEITWFPEIDETMCKRVKSVSPNDVTGFLRLFSKEKSTTKAARRGGDITAPDTEEISHTQLQQRAARNLFRSAWPELFGKTDSSRKLGPDLFAPEIQQELWNYFSLDCATNGAAIPASAETQFLVSRLVQIDKKERAKPWCTAFDWALVCGWTQYRYYDLKIKELHLELSAALGIGQITEGALKKRIERLELRLAPTSGPRPLAETQPQIQIPTGSIDHELIAELAVDSLTQIAVGRLAEAAGNTDLAMEYYQTLAQQEDPDAQFHLGRMLIEKPQDDKKLREGFAWLEKAAGRQHAAACYLLGKRLLAGEGIQKNLSQGIALLTTATEQDFPKARTELGKAYLSGNGVTVSDQVAIDYLEKASEDNEPEAQYVLAQCWAETDPIVAFAWAALAEKNGWEAASELKGKLRDGLPPLNQLLATGLQSALEEKVAENQVLRIQAENSLTGLARASLYR